MSKYSNMLLIGLVCAATVSACSPAAEMTAGSDSVTPEATSPAPKNAEEDIRHFLLQEYPDAGKIDYALAWRDLDGDGADEAIVYLAGPYFCGTGGCNLLVLTSAGPMWRKVGDVSVTRTPVTVLDTSTKGWKDLTVDIAGGGGPSGTALLKFDGQSYPDNASVQPPGTKGTEVLPEDPVFKTLMPATPTKVAGDK